MASIDLDCRLIALHLYVAALNVMPMNNKGEIEESFNIRLEELQVSDIKFLYGYPDPAIAVLFQDNIGRRYLKVYVVDLGNKELKLGPWLKVILDTGVSMLILVPMPVGGVIVTLYTNGEATFEEWTSFMGKLYHKFNRFLGPQFNPAI